MSEPTATTSPTPEPLDSMAAIWQLRTLVCGLGLAILVLSAAFNAFVFKQNRNISAVADARKRQLAQAENRLNALARVASELATYSKGKPELVAIFTRHGMEVLESPANAATP